MTSETIRDPVKDQLLTPQNSRLFIIDYQPVQGGTSVEAHQAALRRIEQAGGKMISLMQLICELQRDWGARRRRPHS